jgi:hypothetical protein
MRYWHGTSITRLEPYEIFVFGSNPEGRHGKGAAAQAVKFGAKYGIGHGLVGQTYALITKNLRPNAVCAVRGYVYPKYGRRSLTLDQIRYNVCELYDVALTLPHLNFLIAYVPSDEESLCGYSTNMLLRECFIKAGRKIPKNIVFHRDTEHLL